MPAAEQNALLLAKLLAVRHDPNDRPQAGPTRTSPVWYAMTTSCARPRAFSFVMARWMRVRTVNGLITSSSAISALDLPAAKAITSRSRPVSSASRSGGASWVPGAGKVRKRDLQVGSEVDQYPEGGPQQGVVGEQNPGAVESRLVAEQAADRIRVKFGDRAIGPAAVFRRAS